jgi:hypothetical protein
MREIEKVLSSRKRVTELQPEPLLYPWEVRKRQPSPQWVWTGPRFGKLQTGPWGNDPGTWNKKENRS